MKKNHSIGFMSLVLILFLVATGQSQLNSLETEYLQLIYFDDSAFLVPHLARCFENSLQFHRDLFQYTPSERVFLLLHDFADYGHGGTTTLPWNYIGIGIEPFEQVYETSPANERMNWLMHHELVHVVATDKASALDRFFRSVFFGKVPPTSDEPISMIYSYLTTPRWYCPRWYHEGIAVFLETWMAGGLGRALGGYDEMVFRTMVRDSAYFYDIVGLESEGKTIDFQVGQNSYLYGTRFVSYMAYQHSPEKVLDWFNRTEDSKKYFPSQFRKVFGISLDDAWSEWIEWEHQWQYSNLDSIQLYSVTSFRPISNQALGSVSRGFYEPSSRKLYVAVLYPGQLAHIASIDIDNGTMKRICNVPGPALYFVTSLVYDPSTNCIFFTTDNAFRWRDLHVVDLHTGKVKELIKDFRTGDLAFHPEDKSIWGVQHHNGRSTVVRILPPYKEWSDMFTLPYGKDVFDLDISPDGKHLVGSLIEVNGRQRLIQMDIEKILQNDSSYDVLYEFENNSPENFIFSPDGRYLFGSSYYTGVSNIWRYDFETEEMDIISNCETGFFRPVPVSNDSLIVFRYSGQGFIPGTIEVQPLQDVSAVKYLGQQIVKKHPIVKNWIADSPASINIDSMTVHSGTYSPIKDVSFACAYPIIQGYKDYAAYGMRFNFTDPIGLHQFHLSASYSPYTILQDNERVHLSFSYDPWPWSLAATYNDADFYDLFGPTKTSRKGYSASVGYRNYLYDEKPKIVDYSINVARYGDLETLPDYQNIAVTYDNFTSVQGKVGYSHVRSTLGAVDYEMGFQWQLYSQNMYVNETFYPHLYTNIDYGFLLPIEHSSLWMRSSFGYSDGNRDDPFANFYFGGFGNNWVDYQSIKRYRDYYSFPGVELNDVGGTTYAKMMLEWTFPPIRFRRLGVPSFYCNWSRIALFTSGIRTNLDSGFIFPSGMWKDLDSKEYQRALMNAGGQIDFRLVLFSTLPSTFSLGYALAFEDHRRFEKEYMISLKLLR